jgi:hypothetical protein
MREVTLAMTTGTLKSVYYAYFHSIMYHGLIFKGEIQYTAKMYTTSQKKKIM